MIIIGKKLYKMKWIYFIYIFILKKQLIVINNNKKEMKIRIELQVMNFISVKYR